MSGPSILLRKHCVRYQNGIRYCLTYTCVLMRALWTFPSAGVTPKHEGVTRNCHLQPCIPGDMVVSLPGFPEQLLPSPAVCSQPGVMGTGCAAAASQSPNGFVLPLVSLNNRCLVRLEIKPICWKRNREVFSMREGCFGKQWLRKGLWGWGAPSATLWRWFFPCLNKGGGSCSSCNYPWKNGYQTITFRSGSFLVREELWDLETFLGSRIQQSLLKRR